MTYDIIISKDNFAWFVIQITLLTLYLQICILMRTKREEECVKKENEENMYELKATCLTCDIFSIQVLRE